MDNKYHIQITDTETGELMLNKSECGTVFFVAAKDFDDIKCGELSHCNRLDYVIHVAALFRLTDTLISRLTKDERRRFKKTLKQMTINADNK